MATLKELIAKKTALEKQIADARQREVKEAIANVRAIVAEFELSVSDVFPKAKGRGRKSAQASEAKYRDPATGQTWSGRGRAPKWIAGKDRSAFAIG